MVTDDVMEQADKRNMDLYGWQTVYTILYR